jgi:hypothetical protein
MKKKDDPTGIAVEKTMASKQVADADNTIPDVENDPTPAKATPTVEVHTTSPSTLSSASSQPSNSTTFLPCNPSLSPPSITSQTPKAPDTVPISLSTFPPQHIHSTNTPCASSSPSSAVSPENTSTSVPYQPVLPDLPNGK